MSNWKVRTDKGGDVDHSDCGYFPSPIWGKKRECPYRNAYIWCVGCPRNEIVEGDGDGKSKM